MCFFFKQKTAYAMRISDWRSDVCSSDLRARGLDDVVGETARALKADADAMLDRLIAEKWLTARGVCAFWPCARDGDSVTIHLADAERSEERRVGKECVRTCRSRWSPVHEKKNKKE